MVLQFDVKKQKIFLRKTKYENLHLQDLFVGNRVNVFSRQLNLIDYGDQYTANKLGSKKERYDCKGVIFPPSPLQNNIMTLLLNPVTMACPFYVIIIFILTYYLLIMEWVLNVFAEHFCKRYMPSLCSCLSMVNIVKKNTGISFLSLHLHSIAIIVCRMLWNILCIFIYIPPSFVQNSCSDKARCSYKNWRYPWNDLRFQHDCDQSQNDKAYMVRSKCVAVSYCVSDKTLLEWETFLCCQRTHIDIWSVQPFHTFGEHMAC